MRPGDEAAIASALASALDGSGPGIAPVDASLPRAPDDGGRGASGFVVSGGGRAPALGDEMVLEEETRLEETGLEETVLAVTTSGSTGAPRMVALTADALRASAAATQERLGGAGQWLLALPLHHIAGLQVLSRSVLAGTEPVTLDLATSFTPEAFAAAAGRLSGPRRYTSLVPTQLHRALASPEGRDALAAFDAVLVGGAATDPMLVRVARDLGIRLTLTYGMTETAGGCVYDGEPLDGVRFRLDGDGRIHLAGPVLAAGYLGEPELTARTFVSHDGERWLRTGDLGAVDGGELHVLGRVDDVITTGGVKVAPAAVESALAELTEVDHASVVGVPDPEWGAVVVAVVVLRRGAPEPSLESVRSHVAHTLGARAAPRRVVVVPELPALGPGKVDRRAVARLAAQSAEQDRPPGSPGLPGGT